MKAKIVKPENKIKKKVGSGGFKETDLVKAQAAIENNEVDFRPEALDLLNQLGLILDDIKSGKIKSEKYFDEIMYPLMQLKAQGGLFRYQLVTDISQIIIDFLENIDSIDQSALDIVEAYRKSLHAILTLQIKTVESRPGVDLCQALTDVCGRYFKAGDKKK